LGGELDRGGQDSEVSAFCSTKGIPVVNDNAPHRRLPSITARPTPAEKQAFARLAAARGVSESALALIAIRAILESNAPASSETTPGVATRESAIDRITIRPRPGDRRVIGDRATRRGMRTSAYLAALVRAHVAANPPLATEELVALKRTVLVLAALGRQLAQANRTVAETGSAPQELSLNLNRTRVAVAALERLTSELARAALVSWETRYD
jgi:hypothetical protein